MLAYTVLHLSIWGRGQGAGTSAHTLAHNITHPHLHSLHTANTHTQAAHTSSTPTQTRQPVTHTDTPTQVSSTYPCSYVHSTCCASSACCASTLTSASQNQWVNTRSTHTELNMDSNHGQPHMLEGFARCSPCTPVTRKQYLLAVHEKEPQQLRRLHVHRS